jgi:hypothetical protein
VIAEFAAAKPNSAESAIEFYRRMVERENQEPIPTPAQSHGDEAVMQIGARRPSNFVKVAIPAGSEISHLYAASGVGYLVEVEDGRRVCWMGADDAREQISSALNVSYFEANSDLRAKLGNKPAQPRGIRMNDWLQAAEDAQPRRSW